MSLVIRDAQLAPFREQADRAFEERLRPHFVEHFAAHCEWLGDERLLRVIRLGIKSARAHDYRGERDICLYISLMFMLGSRFDSDPQLPWAARLLRRSGQPATDRPIEAVYREAMAYLDRIAGQKNELLVRALMRFRDYDAATLDGRSPEQVGGLLARLYPQKAAAIAGIALGGAGPTAAAAPGARGCHGLAVRAVDAAANHGMRGAAAAAIYAAHMLLLGTGFDDDPLYPWAAEVLRDPAAQMTGTRQSLLLERGRAFLIGVGLRGAA